VRIRPSLGHESEFFDCTFDCNPRVATLEPRLSIKGEPKPVLNTFDVDYAFGPNHDNELVYSTVTMPLIDLGLMGGVCTMLAYGQTGSGKTHTIGGILERIAQDLFIRQKLSNTMVIISSSL
jgi:hypothetical protein